MVKKQTIKKYKERIEYLESRRDELLKKVDVREIFIGMIICFLIGLPLLIWGSSIKSVDESGFCLNKLNKHFPEYNFYEAEYEPRTSLSNWVEDGCRGYYRTEKNIVRDGLEELNDYEKEYKDYKLLDKQNIKYLDSDDIKWILIVIGTLLLIISLIVCIVWINRICEV